MAKAIKAARVSSSPRSALHGDPESQRTVDSPPPSPVGIGADEDEEMEDGAIGGAIGGFKALDKQAASKRSIEVSTALDLSELE